MCPKIVENLMFTVEKFYRQSAWTEKGRPVHKKNKNEFYEGSEFDI